MGNTVDKQGKQSKSSKRSRRKSVPNSKDKSAESVPNPIATFRNYLSSERYQKHENGTPRVCFLSLFLFYRDWRRVPIHVLAHSLLILKCERKWIFTNQSIDDNTGVNPIQTRINELNIASDSEFKAFLFKKEQQSRLFWIDDRTQWSDLSQWLSAQIDPMTHLNYQSLILDPNWWTDKFNHEIVKTVTRPKKQKSLSTDVSNPSLKALDKHSGYDKLLLIENCDNIARLCEELITPKWNFQVTQEVLHQSNPSLIPLMKWDNQKWKIKKSLISKIMNEAESTIDKQSPPLATMASSTVSATIPATTPATTPANSQSQFSNRSITATNSSSCIQSLTNPSNHSITGNSNLSVLCESDEKMSAFPTNRRQISIIADLPGITARNSSNKRGRLAQTTSSIDNEEEADILRKLSSLRQVRVPFGIEDDDGFVYLT